MYRVRHKKCDETRPSCINCSSTGRECDGYTEVQPPKRSPKRSYTTSESGESLQISEGSGMTSSTSSEGSKMVLVTRSQSLPSSMVEPGKVGLSKHECYFLDFFRNVGAYNFATYPTSTFLDVVVRQIGESHPSVKHAAMALTVKGHTRAALYFGDENGNQLNDAFVLKQTTKSIVHLLQQPQPKDRLGRRAHREVVMTLCGVLTLLANSQDDFETFKMHLMYGQRAMQEWHDADNFDGSSIAPILSALLAHENCKLQITSNPASFLQEDNPLLLQASYLGNFSIAMAQYTVNRHWEAWSSLVLDNEIPNGFASYSHPGGVLKGRRIGFLFKVRIYAQQVKACLEQIGLLIQPRILNLFMSLRLWEQAACAMVAAQLHITDDDDDLQMSYDGLLIYFRRINDFGKKVLQLQQARQNASAPTFPIDYAVGTPLFFCGYYCRDWSTRREALRLLRALEKRFRGSDATEFLPMKISALERIIDIESHGLRPGDVVPGSARIHYFHATGRQAKRSGSVIRFLYRQLGKEGVVEIL